MLCQSPIVVCLVISLISFAVAMLSSEKPYYALFKDNKRDAAFTTIALNGDIELQSKNSEWHELIQFRTTEEGKGPRRKIRVGDKVKLHFVSRDALGDFDIHNSEEERNKDPVYVQVGVKKDFLENNLPSLQHHITFCREGDTCEFYIPWGVMNRVYGTNGPLRGEYSEKGTTIFTVQILELESTEDSFKFLWDF